MVDWTDADHFVEVQSINREAARLAEGLAVIPVDPPSYEDDDRAMYAMWAEGEKDRQRRKRGDGLDFSERREIELMETWLALPTTIERHA